MTEKKYDVALSFAGEDRPYAEKLAKLLEAGEYSVFMTNLNGRNFGVKTSMFTSHRFTKTKRATVSYSCLNIMPGSYGRNTNSEMLKQGRFRKTKSIFFQSGLMIQRFREFCRQSAVYI